MRDLGYRTALAGILPGLPGRRSKRLFPRASSERRPRSQHASPAGAPALSPQGSEPDAGFPSWSAAEGRLPKFASSLPFAIGRVSRNSRISRIDCRLGGSTSDFRARSRGKGSKQMNPLKWTPEHKFAWVIFCVIGGLLGLLFAWLQDPFYAVCHTSISGEGSNCTRMLFTWLPNVALYWPLPVFGALIAGLTFYALRLLQIPR